MNKRAAEAVPNKPGRPASFMQEDALTAAMNLFWKKGFLAVSAKDLADAMGIQRSSFYNSFGSREKVFLEALNLYATLTPDVPLGNVQPGQPVIPVLVSVLRNICQVRAADPEARGCLVCNSIGELVGVEDALGPRLEEAVQAQVKLLEGLLRQAAQQGEIERLADAGSAARAFVAFLVGLNIISKVIQDEAQLWAVCREFLLGLGIAKQALKKTKRG